MPHTKKCGEATKTTQAQCKCPCGGLAHGLQHSGQPKFRYRDFKSDESITNKAHAIAIELAVLCTSECKNETDEHIENPSNNLRRQYLITFTELHILCGLLYILYELPNTQELLLEELKDNLRQQISTILKNAHIQNKVTKDILCATLEALVDKLITLLKETQVTSGSVTQAKYIIATLAILLCPKPESHEDVQNLTNEFTIQENLQPVIK